MPLAEVEGRLRAELAMTRAQGLAEQKARELADRVAREEPATAEAWQALADGAAVVYLSAEPFGRLDPVAGVGRSVEFAEAAFALDEPGAASAPVRVPRGWAILRLREALPAKTPTLAEVETKVRAAAQRQKASELARLELERARSGRSLAEVAAQLGLEVRDSGPLARRAMLPGVRGSETVVRAAFELEPGATGGPAAIGDGAVLFEVVARAKFDPVRFAAERDAVRRELRREETDRLTQALLVERREQVGVSYEPMLAEQLGLGGAES
jgi:hypothetical protein